MRPVGEETLEPRFRFRYCVGSDHAGNVEAVRARQLDESGLDVRRIGQKSRLA
jgi:hypothetical protein